MNRHRMKKQKLWSMRLPFLHSLFRNNTFNLVMTVTAALLCAAGNLSFSWILKEMADLMSGKCNFTLPAMLMVMGGAFLLFFLSWILDCRFRPVFTAKAMKQYREHAFNCLMKKSIQAFSGENSSFYISALTNDANTIERDLVCQIKSVTQMTASFIAAFVFMMIYSPLLTLVSIMLALIPVIASFIFGNRAAASEKTLSDKREGYVNLLKDALAGFSVIKSFKAEQNISRIHDESNENVLTSSVRNARMKANVGYSAGLAGTILQYGVYTAAAIMAFCGKGITVGTAIVFLQLVYFILAPIQTFPTLYAGMKSSFSLIDKLANELQKNAGDEGTKTKIDLSGGITIKNLEFAYEGNAATLKNVDLKFEEGGCHALIGNSGSGKSTLLNLLTGSSRDYRGDIFYGNTEAKDMSSDSLLDLVSIIQQNVFVFGGTIRENITMFSDFPEEEIDRAVRLAGLSKLIHEKGKDFFCGENGACLSGGERQRISIARALLRKAPVLLVDEATSALDAETSFEVLDAILKLDGHTRIIVTHDMNENILRRCTKLFTLKNGRIAEQGTFEELMKAKGYFYSLFTVSQ